MTDLGPTQPPPSPDQSPPSPAQAPTSVQSPTASPAVSVAARLGRRSTAGNLAAQIGALACLSLASLVVARWGGPAVVGEYALLRVLPWLLGVVCSLGLPIASAYMLAGARTHNARLRPTLIAMLAGGALLAVTVWTISVPLLERTLFPSVSVHVLLLVGSTAATQLVTVWAKACCQGQADMRGSNLLIVAEELLFLPAYGLAHLGGGSGLTAVVVGLVGGGAGAALLGLGRLAATGFFTGRADPSVAIAREVAAYGARAQLGNLLWLVNLRLDFLVLAAIAGPAELGIYAVATKVAELMRLPATAMNYVLYPRFASQTRIEAARGLRRLLPRAGGLTVALAPAVALAGAVAIPVLYGHAFRPAVLPMLILLVGLTVEGFAAVCSAYLWGAGRPGANSWGMGVGVAATVALDVALVPRFGATGAAIASSTAYLVTALLLTGLSLHHAHRASPPASAPAPHTAPADATTTTTGRRLGRDTAVRRTVDIVVAGFALAILSPLLVAIAALVRLGDPGPVLFRQPRMGRDGTVFLIWKYRTMHTRQSDSGRLVSGLHDPRITKVGRVLRVTRLDELPQLVNILRGEMSLFGPRPEVERYRPHYTERELRVFDARPGILGPGALFFAESQAGELDDSPDPDAFYVAHHLHPKLALDLDYLTHRGVRADLALLRRAVILTLQRLTPVWRPPRPTEPVRATERATWTPPDSYHWRSETATESRRATGTAGPPTDSQLTDNNR